MTSETPLFARAAWRSLHFSAKRKSYYRAPYRCFACSIRQAQKPEDRFENGRTTHFGFETISEAQKEQKGELQFARGLVHTD
jgi:2-methoxy-6-polyprenyl-1,4-benzoquinol methylase